MGSAIKTHENLDYAHSFYWFGEVIKAYIHHLKYSGWDTFLPRLINNAIRESELPKQATEAVLIPIPLHRVRQRDRGFNQAMMIAKELAQQWNLKLDDKMLKREKYTQSQTKLSIIERQKNMYMAFHMLKDAPKAVILIDDVLTNWFNRRCMRQAITGKGQRLGWRSYISHSKNKENI